MEIAPTEEIKAGDRVISVEGVVGTVIRQYKPTASAPQTMIRTVDGRQYHAPTTCFTKIGQKSPKIFR